MNAEVRGAIKALETWATTLEFQATQLRRVIHELRGKEIEAQWPTSNCGTYSPAKPFGCLPPAGKEC